MKVYIAGALTTNEHAERTHSQVVIDYIQNVHRMCEVASKVRKMGHAPYVPALDLLLGLVNGDWKEEDYRETNMEFLDVCDAVLVISYSRGVKKEIDYAKQQCIPIYYSLEQLEEL